MAIAFYQQSYMGDVYDGLCLRNTIQTVATRKAIPAAGCAYALYQPSYMRDRALAVAKGIALLRQLLQDRRSH
ncbi:MAG: hypothetical protein V7L27_10785 [Nostoc sp.]|uniref:hypothetical protein n=1 Tax=Nostoc sp. TaxID=1180 RepID=UPI002FF5C25C